MDSLVEDIKNGKLFEAELRFHAIWANYEYPTHIMESIKDFNEYDDSTWEKVESKLSQWRSCYKEKVTVVGEKGESKFSSTFLCQFIVFR